MQTITLTPASFTIQHVNLRQFASVTFTYSGLKASRSASVTVQDPVSLISRRDGRWTCKAKKAANTATFLLGAGTLKMTTYKGEVVKLRLG